MDGGWFWKTTIPDPPPPRNLVKLRMVRGGPEFLTILKHTVTSFYFDSSCRAINPTQGGNNNISQINKTATKTILCNNSCPFLITHSNNQTYTVDGTVINTLIAMIIRPLKTHSYSNHRFMKTVLGHPFNKHKEATTVYLINQLTQLAMMGLTTQSYNNAVTRHQNQHQCHTINGVSR
jgi:hypothetical protein